MKINKHIEIVSSEIRGLSSMSKESRDAVRVVLAKYYTNVGITIVNNETDLEFLAASSPDLVFLGMKYVPKNPAHLRGSARIWLSDFLEERGIMHTGSGQVAHRLELDKALAKQCVLDAGLMTSPFYIVKRNMPETDHATLTFPLFVKPTDRGGGSGIDSQSVVHDLDALLRKSKALAEDLQSDSLIEQYLSGREFSVAVLKDEFSDEFVVMPIELVAESDRGGVRLLSQRVKSSNAEKVLEVIDKALYVKVCKLALEAFHALGARDYGRIDIRLDERGVPHFLEANLLPSLIRGYGSFPKACELNINLAYEAMLLTIVRLGFVRKSSSVSASMQTGKNFRIRNPLSEAAIELV